MYNSSCFYRYSVVDLNQLTENLGGDADYAESVLRAFLKSSIHAIPTGKQTSMAAFNQPSFILGTIREDQPWSLTNAYSKPVWIGGQKTDYVEKSIDQLDSYFEQMNELYGTPQNMNIHFCQVGDQELPYLEKIGQKHASLTAFIKQIGEEINERHSASV